MREDGSVTILGEEWPNDLMTNLLARVAGKWKWAKTIPTDIVLKVSKKRDWKKWAQKYDTACFARGRSFTVD